MASPDFSTLEGIYTMFSPADIVGKVEPNLGGPQNLTGPNASWIGALVGILENNGRGVLSIDDIEARIQAIKQKSDGSIDISRHVTIWTNKKLVDIGDGSAQDAIAGLEDDGSVKKASSLVQVIGPDFPMPPNRNVAMVLSRTPFFSPASRNAKKIEIFLNSMPPTVLAQLVPFIQVEFVNTRDPSEQLGALSQLKLLLGAASKSSLQDPDKAMMEGHTIVDQVEKKELTFVGMEAFTSPVTLTNPTPNKNVGTNGTRYTEILDPFRPFATIEHVSINSRPAGAGYFVYKKGSMSIKVHDRSRLHEISDLLRPRVYTGVTIWMTYGWRAPSTGVSNPYFQYVNNNLMMREAYHIVNSSYAFDNVGQVTINLELFTKGVPELRDLKITNSSDDAEFRSREIKDLIEKISYYRQRLRLDPPEGMSKEIRVFQILDAAEVGEFPDVANSELASQIDSLKSALDRTPHIDKDAVNGLITSMKNLYKPDKADSKKFDVKKRYETRVAAKVDAMFKEVRTGDDPFLPQQGKALGDEITKMVSDLNSIPRTKTATTLKSVVSFGKLFSVFALRSLLSIPEVIDELQVFFYNLNDQCGPIRHHSIAEFPIEMNMFTDAFNDMVRSKGGEKITLEDFVQLVVNSQFLDNRAIGYGLRQYYQPYAKGKDAALKTGKDNEQAFESKLASYSNLYGPFKQPQVEMYIECSHKKTSDEGESDILQMLNYSAKDASIVDLPKEKALSATKIMRIHVYDKQTSPYRAAAAILRNESNTGFISVTSKGDQSLLKNLKIADNVDIMNQVPDLFKRFLDVDAVPTPDGQIRFVSPFMNNAQVKEIVGKLVPTIRFGANGTTITTANLSSKVNPLLSTVQMIRTQNIRNTAQPNGSGDLGLPLRVIPAQLSMGSLGNPLATCAQQYFIDFQTGTTIDALYILTNFTHNFSPGKFETLWTFGYADGYGVFEGAPNIVDQISKLEGIITKDPSKT